ncbi:hypothetical protein KGF57_001947, partial [Candida theae]
MKSINVNFITPEELYQLIDFKKVDVTKVIPGFDPSAGFMLTSPAFFTPFEEDHQPVIQCDSPESLPSLLPPSPPSPPSPQTPSVPNFESSEIKS